MENRVLVVDDEPEICNLLENFLEKEGFKVTTAASAEEALEKIKKEKPKVLLLDIRMPGMGGIAMMKKVREANPEIAIIIITAVVDQKTAQEVIKLGASDYIIKPFDLNYLKRCLVVKLTALM